MVFCNDIEDRIYDEATLYWKIESLMNSTRPYRRTYEAG